MCSNFCQERFVQVLCCNLFAKASASRPYSSLRTGSRTLHGLRARQQFIAFIVTRDISASTWVCFRQQQELIEIQGICTKMLVFFRACPNCGSQIFAFGEGCVTLFRSSNSSNSHACLAISPFSLSNSHTLLNTCYLLNARARGLHCVYVSLVNISFAICVYYVQKLHFLTL